MIIKLLLLTALIVYICWDNNDNEGNPFNEDTPKSFT